MSDTPDDEPERNPEHNEHLTDALAYMMAAHQGPIDRAIRGMELDTAEAHLRALLVDIDRRHKDEARPIIERLAKINALKPPRQTMIVRPIRAGKSHAYKVMQDLAAMIDDAKAEVGKATSIGPRLLAGMADVNQRQQAMAQAAEDFRNAAATGISIRRYSIDADGNPRSERIDPEDFYAKPEEE